MNERDSDVVVNRLLAGENPEDVANDFPLYREEVLSSARTVRSLVNLKSMRPKEEGLRHVLASMRVSDARAPSTPSPLSAWEFVRVSFIYRNAFVIPLLFLVLIASGAYLLPWGASDTPPSLETSVSMESGEAGDTSLAMESAPFMKSAGIQTMSLSQSVPPALPSDQDLASVFGPEITFTTDATEADSAEVGLVADDTSGTESYNTIYDAQAF